MDLRFIPKSGVLFILVSVFIFLLWAKSSGNAPFIWIVMAEVIAFVVCFFMAHIESERK